MYVTDRRRHVTPSSRSARQKTIKNAMPICISVYPSVCHVQTTFLGYHKDYKLKKTDMRRHAVYMRTEFFLIFFDNSPQSLPMTSQVGGNKWLLC